MTVTDPYTHPTGPPVADLHGIPVTWGVDHGTVTITFGGTTVMLQRDAVEDSVRYLFAAIWDAGEYDGAMASADGGGDE
jgi:hypothetical protein